MTEATPSGAKFSLGPYLPVLAALTIAVVLKMAYFDRSVNPIRQERFDGTVVAGVDVPLNVDFDRELILLGLDLPDAVASGGQLLATLYWRVPQPIRQQYSVSLVVVDESGVLVGQSDHQHPADEPTSSWRPDQYAADHHTLTILPGTPPGTYDLLVAVYEYGRPERRLNVLGEGAVPLGQQVRAAEIVVTRPDDPPSLQSVSFKQAASAPLAEGIRLVGYALPHYPLSPGDNFPLTLVWQATQPPSSGLSVRIQVADETGRIEAMAQPPLVPGYDTGQWQVGDVWRAVHFPRLDPALATGSYTISVRMNGYPAAVLGQVSVEAPQRQWQRPPVDIEQPSTFGDVARFVGFGLPQAVHPGDEVPIDVVWQAVGTVDRSYKSFVHLVDNAGRLVTGSDMIPGNWSRPTTGWIAGEYVADQHMLALPADLAPGAYDLRVGLYQAESGQRVTDERGLDHLVLAQELQVTAD